MKRVWAVAENTFKESLRQRILLLLIIFSILLIVISVFIEPFALGEAPKILKDFGVAVASLFGVLIVIIVGSSLIHTDIEKRTIYTVIAKPIKRSEIILGKFLGLLLLVAILESAMTTIHQLLILVYIGRFDLSLLLALPFSLLETMVLLGILLLFSSFSSTTMTSIMGVIFYVIGHASPDLKLFADSTKIAFVKCIAYGFYYILPNLENFNLRLDLVYRLPLHSDQMLFSICYGVIYTVFLIYVSTLVFEKREFK